MKNKIILLALIPLLAVLFITCSPPPFSEPSSEPRGIFAADTATPSNYNFGIVKVRDLVSPFETPALGQVGSHWQVYWSQAQAAVGNAPS